MSDLGNKEIFAKNLKYYMDLNNKDRNDLCRDLGFKYSTLTDWYNANKYPRIDKIEMIANYFNIRKSDLIEDKSKVKTDNLGRKVVSVPFLGSIKAGYNGVINEEVLGEKEIPEELARTGDFFTLSIKGDSMMESLWENDIVAVRKQDYAETGDIAVIVINRRGTEQLKK